MSAMVVNPLPPAVAPEILEALHSVAANDIGHLRYWGAMAAGIRPIAPGMTAVGTAVTVIAPGFDTAMIPHAVSLARPGDILIIDRLGDHQTACLGGVVALAARVVGIAGIIIDGVATDFDEMREVGLPIWCRGESAAMGKLLAGAGALNIPVSCGGVAVLPGQAVLADGSGICVLDPPEVMGLVNRARQIDAARPARRSRIEAGEKLGAVNGVSARIEAALRASGSGG